MSELRRLAEKAIEALEEAEADGVGQIKGKLGLPNGCRCAEGVIADMLVNEGLVERNGDTLVQGPLIYTWANKPFYRSATLLTGALPAHLIRLGQVFHFGLTRIVDINYLNDIEKKSFGEIAESMRISLDEGFYDGI